MGLHYKTLLLASKVHVIQFYILMQTLFTKGKIALWIAYTVTMTQDSTWDIILNLNSGTYVIFPYLDTDKKIGLYVFDLSSGKFYNKYWNSNTMYHSHSTKKMWCTCLKILTPESYSFSRKDQMNRHVASVHERRKAVL